MSFRFQVRGSKFEVLGARFHDSTGAVATSRTCNRSYNWPRFWRTRTDLGIRKPGTWNLERGTPMAPGTWNLERRGNPETWNLERGTPMAPGTWNLEQFEAV